MSEVPAQTTRGGKLKLALLYILVGGLVASALISVTAILIGEFNDVIGKALLTTVSLVVHSLLVLAIVAADKNNRLGKSLIPTTILGAAIANIVTSTLGIWQLWGGAYSWRAFCVYVLLIGAAFLIVGVRKLRLPHASVTVLSNVTVALIGILTLVLIPWLFAPDSSIVTLFYFRLAGALLILTATGFAVTLIFNRIAVSHYKVVKHVTAKPKLGAAMLSIVISVGTLVALFWFIGLFAFIFSASQSYHNENPAVYQPNDYSL